MCEDVLFLQNDNYILQTHRKNMPNRDSIDFANAEIPKLFRKIFIPTLMGMLSYSFVTVIDGIFVGQGVGSDAIAAINISFPIFLAITGFGLMLGMGTSVVASLHLSHDNIKAARINVTQALFFSTIVVLLIMAAVEIFPTEISMMLGASDTLLPWVRDYMVWLIPAGVMQMWSVIGLFVIRLDGSPQFAMWCSVVPALLNIPLDWLFIYPLQMGVKGAAIASMICTVIGGAMAMWYLLFRPKIFRLYYLKLSVKSFLLSIRNIGYQCRIGISALMGEMTMAMLMFVGNITFMKYLGDDGVGAFGLACYYLPFVFNMGNTIAESMQPIISFNYGRGNHLRVLSAVRIAIKTAFWGSLLSVMLFTLFPGLLVGLFVDTGTTAAKVAISGFPLFAGGFLFFVLNLTAIGYFQSVEKVVPATLFALLRGLVFLVPSFFFMPFLFGKSGIWLAMPVSEMLTFVSVLIYCCIKRKTIF